MPQFAKGGARELIETAAAALERVGVENPRLDAELMIAAATGRSRIEAIFGDLAVDVTARSRFAAMVARRRDREPLAYILGRKEFYSIAIEVSPAVLIPRPETEVIVAAALDLLKQRPTARVLDLCTGSGAIALAIATNAPHVIIVASDISVAALALARRNVERMGLSDRVSLRHADCFEPVDRMGPLGVFDLLVANPPYIREGEIADLQPEVARWEPRLALDGGSDGLGFYRRIASDLAAHLEAHGCALIEIDERQPAALPAIFAGSGAAIYSTIPDLSGKPRAVCLRRSNLHAPLASDR